MARAYKRDSRGRFAGGGGGLVGGQRRKLAAQQQAKRTAQFSSKATGAGRSAKAAYKAEASRSRLDARKERVAETAKFNGQQSTRQRTFSSKKKENTTQKEYKAAKSELRRANRENAGPMLSRSADGVQKVRAARAKVAAVESKARPRRGVVSRVARAVTRAVRRRR